MASRLPLLAVFVSITVMVSLLPLLLQSLAAAAAVPHIEMVRSSNHRYNSSSINDNCAYAIRGRANMVSSTESTLTFDVYDKYGNGIHVSTGLSIGQPLDIDTYGPCIKRPCNLVVTSDGAVPVVINSVRVIVLGGDDDDVTFVNTAWQWIGPGYSMQLQINNCDSMQ